MVQNAQKQQKIPMRNEHFNTTKSKMKIKEFTSQNCFFEKKK